MARRTTPCPHYGGTSTTVSTTRSSTKQGCGLRMAMAELYDNSPFSHSPACLFYAFSKKLRLGMGRANLSWCKSCQDWPMRKIINGGSQSTNAVIGGINETINDYMNRFDAFVNGDSQSKCSLAASASTRFMSQKLLLSHKSIRPNTQNTSPPHPRYHPLSSLSYLLSYHDHPSTLPS